MNGQQTVFTPNGGSTVNFGANLSALPLPSYPVPQGTTLNMSSLNVLPPAPKILDMTNTALNSNSIRPLSPKDNTTRTISGQPLGTDSIAPILRTPSVTSELVTPLLTRPRSPRDAVPSLPRSPRNTEGSVIKALGPSTEIPEPTSPTPTIAQDQRSVSVDPYGRSINIDQRSPYRVPITPAVISPTRLAGTGSPIHGRDRSPSRGQGTGPSGGQPQSPRGQGTSPKLNAPAISGSPRAGPIHIEESPPTSVDAQQVPPEAIPLPQPWRSGQPIPASLDISTLTPEQQTQARVDYRVRRNILRSAYPNLHIPEMTDDTQLLTLVTDYRGWIQQIVVQGNQSQNRMYMVVGFVVVEVLFTNCFGLNISGYTILQLNLLDQYESMLIELGERNLLSSMGSWPVEFRICILALINAAIFFVIKLLAGNISSDAQIGIHRAILGMMRPTGDNQAGPTIGGVNISTITNLLGNVDINRLFNTVGSTTQTQGAAPPVRTAARPPYTE